jgi:hypothetical protein
VGGCWDFSDQRPRVAVCAASKNGAIALVRIGEIR